MYGMKVFLISLILAIIATLITGLINTTPRGLLGASWYGFPASWMMLRVVAPQYNPMAISYLGLMVDLVLWTVVIALVVNAATNRKQESTTSAATSSKSRRRR